MSPMDLTGALARLHALAPEPYHPEIGAWAGRLADRRLRVLVAGEAKRGKSTVVNALLGRAALPTGVAPVTALATTVVHGYDEHVAVAYRDGHTERWPLDRLADAVTEHGNPANRRGISHVQVHLAAPLLAEGLEIVDTPGTGSVHAHNTAEAQRVLPTLDAAIVVLTVDPPVSASELDLLAAVHRRAVRLFVLLNKADRLDPEECREAVAFTASVLAGRLHEDLPVRAVSARRGDADPAFASFAADLVRYLQAKGEDDVRRAVAGHARSLAARLLEEVDLALAVSRQADDEAAATVAALRQRLDAARQVRAELAADVQARARNLRAALDAAASEAIAACCPLVRDSLAAQLAALDGQPVAHLERRGRDVLVTRTRDLVEAWRAERAQALQAGLADVERQVRHRLLGSLAELHDTVTTVLGQPVRVPEVDVRLVDAADFFYVTDEDVDTAELLAGLVRRHLPGGWGRRWATRRLYDELPGFVAAQVGRARGDLQARLEESARQLLRAADERYAGATDHLQRAVGTAQRLREASRSTVVREQDDLLARQAKLRELVEHLSPYASGNGGRPDRTEHRPSPDGRGGDQGQDHEGRGVGEASRR